MSASLQKHKNSLHQVSLAQQDRKDFMNPISKTTFDALPRIYGQRKKKKYTLKYTFDKKGDISSNRVYPAHHCCISEQKLIDRSNKIGLLVGIEQDSGQPLTKRFKTEMKSYDKKSTQKLSRPKGAFCNRRYCMCNKQHGDQVSRNENKSKTKIKALKSLSIRLPQIDKMTDLDDYQSKHKVVMTTLQGRQAQSTSKQQPFTLLDLLRNTQRQNTFNRPSVRVQEKPVVQKTINHAKSVEVQVQTEEQQNQINSPRDFRNQGATAPIATLAENKTGRRTSSAVKQHSDAFSVQVKLKNSNAKQNILKQEHQFDNPKARLQKMKNKYKINKDYQSDSGEDDNRSMVSSISTASISKYVFEGGKKANTMFHSLKMKQSSGSAKSSKIHKKQKEQKEIQNQTQKKKYVYQKKSGLFIIPEQDQFVSFLKDYEPMSKNFKIKNLVRNPNFKVLKSQDGIYFGEFAHQKRNGKGLMVTQRHIFEGNYKQDLKTYGCQKNIDGVYKGEFANGLREGYGTFEWNNGQIFQGEWKQGTKNGYGTWKSPKGDFYEGQWLLNRQHGKGTYKHRMSTYRGYFKQYLKHGEGEEIFLNGDRYFGNYKQGKPDGRGKYQWADGSYFEGDFISGVRQGKGVWVYNNGTKYEGQFKKDFKDGRGIQRYKSGQYYQGLFKNGSKYQGILHDLNNNAIKITHDEDDQD